MRFTDQLRESVNEQWDTIVNHRFTTEIAEGSINPKVLVSVSPIIDVFSTSCIDCVLIMT